jgi:hypothetical protein
MTLTVVSSCLGWDIASAAPAQLLNKTVVISWSRDITQKKMDGTVFNTRRDDTRQIYVSTAGRVFMRSISRAWGNSSDRQRTGSGGLQRANDIAPGDTKTPEGVQPLDVHFEGNSLVMNRAHYSGASQLRIDFDSGFTTCTMKALSGKAGGAPIVWKGLNGETYEVISNTVTSSSCEIRGGNLFAGQ